MTTLTRASIVDRLHDELGLSRAESSILLQSFLEGLSGTLERGETVKLSGFGTFAVRRKSERMGRNPKTGVEARILARVVLVFRPSQILRDRLNPGETAAGT